MRRKLGKRFGLAFALVAMAVAMAMVSSATGVAVDQALLALRDWFPYN